MKTSLAILATILITFAVLTNVVAQNSKGDAFPEGFVYTRYPGQEAPGVLWPPSTNWVEITSDSAGDFFRSCGGGAEEFGMRQGENSPRLVQVTSILEKATVDSERNQVDTVAAGTSQALWTGDDVTGKGLLLSTKFTLSGGEVRPANRCIQLWKKINKN